MLTSLMSRLRRLLVAVAQRLEGCLRQCDCLCRIGGDEFTALLEEAQTEPAAKAVADRIEEALAEPFVIAGLTLEGTATVGIAVHPADSSSADALLRSADTAMYQDKRNRRQARTQRPTGQAMVPGPAA